MTFCHHGILVPKLLILGHFGGLSQPRENQPVMPNASRAKQLTMLAAWLVAWWLGGILPAGPWGYVAMLLCCYVAMLPSGMVSGCQEVHILMVLADLKRR